MDSVSDVPYHSLEAEQAVIGSILRLNNAHISEVYPEMFYDPRNIKIINSILNIHKRNETIDMVTVIEELDKNGLLSRIGGTKYLSSIIESVPSLSRVDHYIQIVKKHEKLRNLRAILLETSDLVSDSKDFLKSMSFLKDKLNTLYESVSSEYHKVSDIFDDLMEDIMKAQNGEYIGIKSGFPALDKSIYCFEDKTLNVIAARTTIGKTAFVLNVIHNQNFKNNESILMFSTEMDRTKIMRRLFSIHSGVPLWHIKKENGMTNDNWREYDKFIEYYSSCNFYINDSDKYIENIVAQSEKLASKNNLRIIVIDHLNLIYSRQKFFNRPNELAYITGELKSLAKRIGVVVLCAVQANRDASKSSSKRVSLDTLRGSGTIEQDSDIVLGLHRESVYSQEDPIIDIMEVDILKYRDGSLGSIKLQYDGECVKLNHLNNHLENLIKDQEVDNGNAGTEANSRDEVFGTEWYHD